jgi:glycosyltransferase involved in cell wall biosynthesis
MTEPIISVVVPSHERPLRLRWLLNALEEQTLARGRWEVIVAHDSGPETQTLLHDHPLAADGTLRELRFEPRPGPAMQRNAGWRAARADTILFTDDDCRPPRDWLAQAVDAAQHNPGAILQGTTRPDPDELAIKLHAPFARSLEVTPPSGFGETANIAYPRALLDALGGFDEQLPRAAAEDTDLALRAQEQGARLVAAPAMLTYHCVEAGSLVRRLRDMGRWQHLAYIVHRHPQMRENLPARVFWKPAHARLPLALAGAFIAKRHPLVGGALAAPWIAEALPSYGSSLRGRARAVSELPAHLLIDLAETATMIRGSIRYRTLIL